MEIIQEIPSTKKETTQMATTKGVLSKREERRLKRTINKKRFAATKKIEHHSRVQLEDKFRDIHKRIEGKISHALREPLIRYLEAKEKIYERYMKEEETLRERAREKELTRKQRDIEKQNSSIATKERVKIEKAKEKAKVLRKARSKEKKRLADIRYRTKKKEEMIAERGAKGDTYGIYRIILTRDYKAIRSIGQVMWSSLAYDIYNKAIERNEREVVYPRRILRKNTSSVYREPIFEILIIRAAKDGQTPAMTRDENGRIIENIIANSDEYEIIAKHTWQMEETFAVHGHHPVNDRKTFSFILNNIILNNLSADTTRRVFSYKKYVIVQYDNDIDIITCKTAPEAGRLCSALWKAVGENKYIFFGNSPLGSMSLWLKQKISEKTGRKIL